MHNSNVTGVVCEHCGEQVRQPIYLNTTVEPCSPDQEKVFCCVGCRSVYELLQLHGMCDYYTIAEGVTGSRRVNVGVHGDIKLLQDTAVAAKFIKWEVAETLHLCFEIPDVHCASCIWLLDQLHRFDEGIQSSSVDFLKKTIQVTITKSRTSVEKVARLLVDLGYPPLLTAEGNQSSDASRNTTLRSLYMRIGIAGFAFGNIMVFSVATYFAGGLEVLPNELKTFFPVASVLLSLPVLLYSAKPWFSSALASLRNIFIHGRGLKAWNLDVPVAMGMLAIVARSVVDIVTGHGEGFLDSFTGLVFFLLIGRLILQKTYDAIKFNRSYRSFFPLSTRREKAGITEVISIEKVVVGDILRLRNAEIVPTDSILLDAITYVDYSFVTGESYPIECLQGQKILAGGRIIGKEVRVSAIADVNHRNLATLWEQTKKNATPSSYATFSDRFGVVFTVTTLSVAIGGLLFWLPDLGMAFRVFAAVLIIACPCALTIAAPITFGHAMGLLGRRGIYLRSPQTISELLNVGVVALDKTGTLTTPHGELDLSMLEATEEEKQLLATLASQSTHPISRAIADSVGSVQTATVHVVEELPGLGVRGIINGVPVVIGKAELVGKDAPVKDGTHCSVDGKYLGYVCLRSVLRPLSFTGREPYDTVLISGDSPRDSSLFAPWFGKNMWFSQSPTDKVERIRELQHGGRRVLMVGDGLNDAGALNVSDVSIAVTDQSSTLAPASDIVMSAGNVRNVNTLLRYASNMQLVVWTSIVFTIGYNIIGFTLAVLGILSPVITAILMPLSNLAVIGISIVGAEYRYRRLQWE